MYHARKDTHTHEARGAERRKDGVFYAELFAISHGINLGINEITCNERIS